MTATERLRQLLDERGVEWTDDVYWPRLPRDQKTEWVCDGWPILATEDVGGKSLTIRSLTPAQAVAATVGMGTCRPILDSERDKRPYIRPQWVCFKCGCQLAEQYAHVWQHYCPNCGRRVERGDM